MLWPQKKLTMYDFSYLQITSEYDNRPGTGRFLRNFSCVVTYSMGGGRRLYMISSADARPGNVRCPDGVVRDQPWTPYNSPPILHGWNTLSRAKMNKKYQNSPSFLQRNRLFKYQETPMLTLTVMGVKTTLAQDWKHLNNTFSLHVIHP